MKKLQRENIEGKDVAVCSVYELTHETARTLSLLQAESERRFLAISGEGHPAESELPTSDFNTLLADELGPIFEVTIGRMGPGRVADYLGLGPVLTAIFEDWGVISCSACGSAGVDMRVDRVLESFTRTTTGGTVLLVLPVGQISFGGEQPSTAEVAEWFGAERIVVDGAVKRVSELSATPSTFDVVVGSFEAPFTPESRRRCESEVRALLARGVGALSLCLLKDRKRGDVEPLSSIRQGFWCEHCARDLGIGSGGPAPSSLRVRLAADSWTMEELLDLPSHHVAKILDGRTDSSSEYVDTAKKFLRRACELLDRGGLSYLSLGANGEALSAGESFVCTLIRIILGGLSDCTLLLDDVTTQFLPSDLERIADLIGELGTQGIRTIIPIRGNIGGRSTDFTPSIQTIPLAGLFREFHAAPTSGTKALRAAPSKENQETLLLESSGLLPIRGKIEIPTGSLVALRGPSRSPLGAIGQQIVKQVVERDGDGGFDSATYLSVIDLALTSSNSVGDYSGGYPIIVKTLLQSREARRRGLTPGDFSLSKSEYRCAGCNGRGWIVPPSGDERVDALASCHPHLFLQPCVECLGGRFGNGLQEVDYGGRSVNEILRGSISDARILFQNEGGLSLVLSALCEIGLGDVAVGGPVSLLTLDQRCRLNFAVATADLRPAARKRKGRRALIAIESPSRMMPQESIILTGEAFHELTRQGHTVLCIDNSEWFLNLAECVIEVGSEIGQNGRKVSYPITQKESVH